jgi:polysaccharide export outer membrane protein
MLNNNQKWARFIQIVCFLVLGTSLLLSSLAVLAHSQESGPLRSGAKDNDRAAENDNAISDGDIVSVSVADAPEWGGKFRVNDSGAIEIGGLSKPVQAEGLTPDELARSISQALIDAKQLRAPRINVFVEEYHGRTVTVLGAVLKPAAYPLQKRTSVLDALSLAGGALPGAGGTVTVIRGPASAEATGTAVGSAQIIDMSRVVSGGDLSGNVQVRNGDVVTVSTARVVYVVGAVTKPGGFTLADPGAGLSVARAVAMAEGFTSLASTRHALVIRQSTSDTARQEVPVDVQDILTGKAADVVLAPDDILYIPESGAKKTIRAMGQVAMALVNGVAVYGVGYRLGTL